jgi:cytochrome P450
MIGKAFLDGGSWDYPFVTEFMSFQDTLEDVTAKAVVLPRWLALPAMLWPLQRRRERLQQIIANRLQTILDNKDDDYSKPDDLGFWLEELLVKDKQHTVEEIAEYIVGLLFAAHKNPAIGAAQAYLMLWERGTAQDQINCTKEAKTLLETPDWSTYQQSCHQLSRLCLETLRLTAHSIGGVRTAQQPVVIQNYKIPKGASVALSHICPNLQQWSDPQTFDMNRPLEEYQDEYRFTTFSHGIHKCPGQQLALVMLKCTVAILLTKYEINLPTIPPPLCFERATLAQREGPVMVTIRRKE